MTDASTDALEVAEGLEALTEDDLDGDADTASAMERGIVETFLDLGTEEDLEEAGASGIDPLDELMAEVTAGMEAKARLRTIREQAKDRRLRPRQRDALASEAREWEAKLEWHAESNCALFLKQRCACGAEHTVFGGFFEFQTHRTQAFTRRWVKVETALRAGLSQEVLFNRVAVPVCSECAESKGWALAQGHEVTE